MSGHVLKKWNSGGTDCLRSRLASDVGQGTSWAAASANDDMDFSGEPVFGNTEAPAPAASTSAITAPTAAPTAAPRTEGSSPSAPASTAPPAATSAAASPAKGALSPMQRVSSWADEEPPVQVRD